MNVLMWTISIFTVLFAGIYIAAMVAHDASCDVWGEPKSELSWCGKTACYVDRRKCIRYKGVIP